MIDPRKLAIVLIAFMLPSSALADQVGKWQSGTVQGFTKYWTVNDDGAHFTIWCKAQRDHPVSLISIDIQGHPAPPRKRVKIVVGRTLVKLTADSNGYLPTGCAACADSFVYLWNRIRSSSHLSVMFDDDRRAGFSLEGAMDILPGAACIPASGR
jgi:hypothetical protein